MACLLNNTPPQWRELHFQLLSTCLWQVHNAWRQPNLHHRTGAVFAIHHFRVAAEQIKEAPHLNITTLHLAYPDPCGWKWHVLMTVSSFSLSKSDMLILWRAKMTIYSHVSPPCRNILITIFAWWHQNQVGLMVCTFYWCSWLCKAKARNVLRQISALLLIRL